MSTTQKSIEAPNVDQELAEELSTVVAATDGEVVYGTVKSVERSGEQWPVIVVTVWLPTEKTITETFEYPKPPLEDSRFTRFCNTYGHGLVDLDGLEGAEVPCRYTDDEEWTIEVPEPDHPRRERLRSFVDGLTFRPDRLIEDDVDFTFGVLLWPLVVPMVTFMVVIREEMPGDFQQGVALFSVGFMLWAIAAVLGVVFL